VKGNFSETVIRISKSAYFGFLGATAIIHITPLARPIVRDFENKYLAEKHDEFETATLLIVGFLAIIMEPVIYIVNLAKSLEKHGLMGFLWLAPVVISQSYAFTRWIMRRQSYSRGL
jgi:hypothetical protein